MRCTWLKLPWWKSHVRFRLFIYFLLFTFDGEYARCDWYSPVRPTAKFETFSCGQNVFGRLFRNVFKRFVRRQRKTTGNFTRLSKFAKLSCGFRGAFRGNQARRALLKSRTSLLESLLTQYERRRIIASGRNLQKFCEEQCNGNFNVQDIQCTCWCSRQAPCKIFQWLSAKKMLMLVSNQPDSLPFVLYAQVNLECNWNPSNRYNSSFFCHRNDNRQYFR